MDDTVRVGAKTCSFIPKRQFLPLRLWFISGSRIPLWFLVELGAAMTYDADGNLTSDGTNSYIWDARGRLVALAGSNVAAYQYDAFGRRVQNTMNGVMTQYLYDGMNPVEELDGSSPPNVTATMLTGLGIDQYFARTDSNGTVSYLTGMLGSTIALANSSGTITTQYSYEPYGKTTVAGSSTNPFQFTGRENDGTGLYYYRARYYSPTFSRFISQDPIGFGSGTWNLYAYAGDSPVVYVDPSGKLWFGFIGIPINILLGGSLGGTIGGAVFGAAGDLACGPLCGIAAGIAGNRLGNWLVPPPDNTNQPVIGPNGEPIWPKKSPPACSE